MGIDRDRFKTQNSDDWVDLLAHDPTSAAERLRLRQQAVKEASKPQGRNTDKPRQASVPATRENTRYQKVTDIVRRAHYWLLSSRKRLIVSGAIMVLLAVGVTAVVLVENNVFSKENSVDNTSTPTYALPDGNAQGVEGDANYDIDKDLVSYKDSIGGVEITVNQQPIPEEIKENLEENIKKVANDLGATTVLVTASPTAYMKEAALGKQIVLFAKGEKLFVVQSEGKIDEYDWASYITNLQ